MTATVTATGITFEPQGIIGDDLVDDLLTGHVLLEAYGCYWHRILLHTHSVWWRRRSGKGPGSAYGASGRRGLIAVVRGAATSS